MYPENPEGTRLIVGSMNVGYVSDTAGRELATCSVPKCAPIPLGHSDGHVPREFTQRTPKEPE